MYDLTRRGADAAAVADIRQRTRLVNRVRWTPGLTLREVHAHLHADVYGTNTTQRILAELVADGRVALVGDTYHPVPVPR